MRREYATINLSALEAFEDGAVVDAQALKNAGIVKNAKDGIKVLGNGELTKKLTVKAAKFSKSAAEENRGQWWESRGDLTCWKLSAMPGRWRTSARGSSTR